MADFAVKVVRLEIHHHPNADALEIAQIGGYQSIVRKDQFESGQLAAYIPEQAVLPDALIEELGLTGRLAGSKHNRVKAIRLRGVLSQGLCYPAREGWELGQDVTEELGVIKYIPPVPTHMDGEVFAAGHDRCIRYDIENLKAWPQVLEDGEPVVFTEKLHGTWTQLGVLPQDLAHPEHGRLVVSSKGLASRGLAFRPNAEANASNLYLRAARQNELVEKLDDIDEATFVLGETFGAGVQDLGYGANARRAGQLGFRVFDVYVGLVGQGRYLNDDELEAFCQQRDLTRVPLLYRGPYSAQAVEEHTRGEESVSGEQAHIREGIVIRPQVERRHLELGRVQLKSISPDYLLRKGGTEFN